MAVTISNLTSVSSLTNNDMIPIVNGNDTKKVSVSQLSNKIAGDISGVGFTPTVVQTLPTQDIDTHTIYLVPKTGTTGDIYDEYLYINSNWEHIGSTSVDLSNYLSKTNTTSFTPTEDYNPATKKYVDDAVASSGGGGDTGGMTATRFVVNNVMTHFYTAFSSVTSYSNINNVSNIIVNVLNDYIEHYTSDYTHQIEILIYVNGKWANSLLFIRFGPLSSATPTNIYLRSNFYSDVANSMTIHRGTYRATYTDGVATGFAYRSDGIDGNIGYLSLTNTTAYTPTSDYHPATKKYVDDKIKSYTGYDATKTQILKNVNGTLTWVDE